MKLFDQLLDRLAAKVSPKVAVRVTHVMPTEIKAGHKYVLAFNCDELSMSEAVAFSRGLEALGAAGIMIGIHGPGGLRMIDITDADGKIEADKPQA